VNILLTGGAGFIGSHLSERLLRDGHEVTIVDDLNDFYSPEVKRANLAAIGHAGRVTFHEADVCDEERMFGIGRERSFDVIIHRSEEHTSELQSLRHLVCRLLLEKKKKKT